VEQLTDTRDFDRQLAAPRPEGPARR
jgi:hypothetical protein